MTSALGLLDALPDLAEAIRPRPVPAVSGHDAPGVARPTGWCSAGTRPTRRSGCRRSWPPRRSPLATPWSAGPPRGCAVPAAWCSPRSPARGPRTRSWWPTCRAPRPSRSSGTRACGRSWPTPRARPASATWPASGGPTPPARPCAPTSPRARATTRWSCSRAPTSRRPRRRGARRLRQRGPAVHVGQADHRRAPRSGRTSPRSSRPPSRRWWSATPRIRAPTSARSPRARRAPAPGRRSPRRSRAGGEVLVGAGEVGAHFTPTVVRLQRAALGVALWREESFAPLRGLVVADDAADALALANDTPYALGAAVFGPGRRRSWRACAPRACWSTRARSTRTPTWWSGGVGDSGLAGARPKIEQMVWARRVHRAGGPRRRTRRCCQWTKASRPGRPSSQPTPEPRQPA